MNKIIPIVILISTGVLLGINLTFSQELPKSEISNKVIVSSESSLQGMLQGIYLFNDERFLEINQLTRLFEKGKPQCYEGKLPLDTYNSFIKFIKASGILNTEITQKDEPGLLCEGSDSIKVNIDGKINSLSLPCVSEYSESTKKAKSVMENVTKKLYEIANASKRIGRKGGYIQTINFGNCDELVRWKKQWSEEELKYETHKLSDLDPNLKKGLTHEGAFVYVGIIDESIESYHRRYYRIGDTCYFVLLYQFDGNLFKDYDEMLREKK